MPGFGRGAASNPPNNPPTPTGGSPGLRAFGRVGQVDGPGGGGAWINDGTYYAVLNRIRSGNSKQNKGEYAGADFTIVEVVTAFPGDPDRKVKPSNVPGEKVVNLFMFDATPFDLAVRSFRGLIGAAMDLNPDATVPGAPGYASPDEWTTACVNACANDGLAIAGLVFLINAITTPTKKPGGFVTKIFYQSVPDDVEQRILAAYKAMLGQA